MPFFMTGPNATSAERVRLTGMGSLVGCGGSTRSSDELECTLRDLRVRQVWAPFAGEVVTNPCSTNPGLSFDNLSPRYLLICFPLRRILVFMLHTSDLTDFTSYIFHAHLDTFGIN